MRETKIPKFENDFGVSEEVERCIFDKSLKILMDIKESKSQEPNDIFLRTLAESCLHSRSQQHSVDYLKRVLHTLECIQTKDDVIREFANLSKIGYSSLFQIIYRVENNRHILCLDGNTSALPISFYSDAEKVKKYKQLLQKVGPLLHTDNLEDVFPMEKSFVSMLESVWSEEYHKTTGKAFAKKFPGINWSIWFEEHGLQGWKTMTFYYRTPRWIRFISRMLKEVSISYWKLFLARAYILPSLEYLPPPFDEFDFLFFGKQSQGQVVKTPQQELFVRIVYDYCGDLFSKIFWEKEGDVETEKSLYEFVDAILHAACSRIQETEWLE